MCGHASANKSHLNIHMESHEKTKTFICEQCGKSFGTKFFLNQHIASVHVKQKPFKCTHCEQFFAYKDNLKKNIASVHENKKPFDCPKCEKSFSRKDSMNNRICTMYKFMTRRKTLNVPNVRLNFLWKKDLTHTLNKFMDEFLSSIIKQVNDTCKNVYDTDLEQISRRSWSTFERSFKLLS